MILDRIENLDSYKMLPAELFEALSLLKDESLVGRPPGKHEIEGERLFQISQEYETSPFEDGVFEAHRQYIDIQFVLEGSEKVGYSPIDKLTPKDSYQEDGDYQLFEIPQESDTFTLRKGMFAVFLPQDGHMPGKHFSTPSKMHKVVLKLKF